MINILGLVEMVATAALLIWSGFRAWRVRNRFLKWGGVGEGNPHLTRKTILIGQTEQSGII